jgi:hypothetical protein
LAQMISKPVYGVSQYEIRSHVLCNFPFWKLTSVRNKIARHDPTHLPEASQVICDRYKWSANNWHLHVDKKHAKWGAIKVALARIMKLAWSNLP